MIKNLIISLMGSWIISRMSFWIYDDISDGVIIFLGLTIVLLAATVAIEDAIKSYMRSRFIKRWRVNRFKDVVRQNTTPNTRAKRVQECNEIIRTLEDAKRTHR